MPFVSITRLRLRSWRFLPAFFVYALRSGRQASRAEGNLAVTIVREARNTFWTRTVWTSEQAMRAFMVSGTHGKVMRHLLEWCDEASVVHWTQDSPEPPSWEQAYQKLLEVGRPSKVNHPTEVHRLHKIPAPQIQTNAELRLK
jgi:hypothetical protein